MTILQMSDFFSIWITSRALGLTAYLLFFLSMATGMIQGMKGVLPAYRLAIGVIHQSSSWLGWLCVLSHALILVFDDFVGFSLKDLFIPFSSEYETIAVSFGVLAMYILFILLVSSDLMKMLGRKWWRIVHSLSFAGFALSFVHGLFFSTIVRTPVSNLVYIITLSILLFLGFMRYLHNRVPRNRKVTQS